MPELSFVRLNSPRARPRKQTDGTGTGLHFGGEQARPIGHQFRTIFLNDVKTDPRRRFLPHVPKMQASYTPGPWSPLHLFFVTGLAPGRLLGASLDPRPFSAQCGIFT